MQYKEAYEKAKARNTVLTAYEFHHGHRVHLIHEDSTVLDFDSAFYEKCEDWIFIFTEHHGFLVYPLEDLEFVSMYYLNEDTGDTDE